VTYALTSFLLLVALATLSLSRRTLRGTSWQLLRSLLPSWRFFEEVDVGPELSFRVVVNGKPGPWYEAIERSAQRPSLWLNPQGNLELLKYSLVDQLVDDLGHVAAEHVAGLVSYRLVRLLVEEAQPIRGAPLGSSYQFRITREEDAQPLFTSVPHAVDGKAV
jgi:hypothetical protein